MQPERISALQRIIAGVGVRLRRRIERRVNREKLASLRVVVASTEVEQTRSEIIFAFVVAWIWLGEGLNAVQLIGAAVVLAGNILAQTARHGKVVDADLALVTGPIETVR